MPRRGIATILSLIYCGTISITARFQRSVVGALQEIAADAPATVEDAVLYCTQNVSLAGDRYSLSFVWPALTVRAIALSQSSPTPHTSELARVVVSEALGAPLAAPALATAPFTVRLAPWKAATVIIP